MVRLTDMLFSDSTICIPYINVAVAQSAVSSGGEIHKLVEFGYIFLKIRDDQNEEHFPNATCCCCCIGFNNF